MLALTSSSELYATFQQFPVIDQFCAVTAFSLFALGFAATVREYRTDFMERWAARIVGACGVGFLVAFAFRMTLTVDRLQNQIAQKGSYETSPPLAQQIGDMVAETATTVQTPKGRTVSWDGARSMSTAIGRTGFSAIRYRDAADFAGRSDRCFGSVPIGASGVRSEQPRAVSEF